ncbi:MAG TPA: hypothetical protein VN640_10250 [Sphingomicrobium sp.]|jgi:hypothetical protein|nr:hypothetical protein [Sphingomicrobium sp.]
MDNDSIRSVGATTLVEIWIDGKLRSICVTRAAIEESLGLAPDQAKALSDDDRCEFVRQHMAAVVKAARDWLRDGHAEASSIIIDTGQLPRKGAPRVGDRRKGERRKTERRTIDRGRPEGERRVAGRRKGERRRTTAPKPSDG